VLFFNDYLPFVGSPPKCYLTPLGIDKIDADISTISRLSTDSPCPIVASVTLNLLEISPRVAHLKVAIDAVESWLEVFPEDTGFWIGSAFGRRACKVLQLSLRAGSPGRDAGTEELSRVSAVLSALVRVGVAEASALEKELFGKS
jgi:hypothetical protein